MQICLFDLKQINFQIFSWLVIPRRLFFCVFSYITEDGKERNEFVLSTKVYGLNQNLIPIPINGKTSCKTVNTYYILAKDYIYKIFLS